MKYGVTLPNCPRPRKSGVPILPALVTIKKVPMMFCSQGMSPRIIMWIHSQKKKTRLGPWCSHVPLVFQTFSFTKIRGPVKRRRKGPLLAPETVAFPSVSVVRELVVEVVVVAFVYTTLLFGKNANPNNQCSMMVITFESGTFCYAAYVKPTSKRRM